MPAMTEIVAMASNNNNNMKNYDILKIYYNYYIDIIIGELMDIT